MNKMSKVKYLIVGLLLGWLTVGVMRAGYLTSDVQKVINLLQRIAYNTENLR